MSEIRFESYYGVSELGGSSLTHSGIMGMKWGRRRYQNSDGSLTPLGREHYGVGPPRGSKSTDEGKEKAPGNRKKSTSFSKTASRILSDTYSQYKRRSRQRKIEQERAAAEKKRRDAEAAEAKKREAEEKARRESDEKERQAEAEKQRIINSGNAEDIQRIMPTLSDAELSRALQRIDSNKRLSQLTKVKEEPKKERTLSESELALKREILADGSPSNIRRNMDLFTTEELADALTRAEYNQKLKNLKNSGNGMFFTLSKTAQNLGTIADSAAKVKKLFEGKDNKPKTKKSDILKGDESIDKKSEPDKKDPDKKDTGKKDTEKKPAGDKKETSAKKKPDKSGKDSTKDSKEESEKKPEKEPDLSEAYERTSKEIESKKEDESIARRATEDAKALDSYDKTEALRSKSEPKPYEPKDEDTLHKEAYETRLSKAAEMFEREHAESRSKEAATSYRDRAFRASEAASRAAKDIATAMDYAKKLSEVAALYEEERKRKRRAEGWRFFTS